MKCDHLIGRTFNGEVYVLASEAMEAIAELKEKLMPCLNGDCILTCEVVEKYGKENAELKQKLEDVNELVKTARQMLDDAKATAYTEMVDAGMENRRLKRALWMARAERAKSEKGFWVYKYNEDCGEFNYTIASRSLASDEWMRVWEKVERKCRAKAEEYK
jgi:NurA-like 5'-3' nuclease